MARAVPKPPSVRYCCDPKVFGANGPSIVSYNREPRAAKILCAQPQTATAPQPEPRFGASATPQKILFTLCQNPMMLPHREET